ncbi:MAG: hypothetical protein R3C14_21175 [Caldilineaceae bacterium]
MIVRWDKKDADRFAAPFRQDAIFIDVVDNAMIGPAAIARGHALPCSTILKEAVHRHGGGLLRHLLDYRVCVL